MWLNNEYMTFPQAREFLKDPKNADTLDRIYRDLVGKFRSVNTEANVNDFAPAELWDAEAIAQIDLLINNVDANESGLEGSALDIYYTFGNDVKTAHDYIISTNPNGDFAKKSQIFLPIAQTDFGMALEQIGVPVDWLNAGPNEKVNDPNSAYHRMNKWKAIETFAYQKNPNWFNVEDGEIVYKNGNNLYEVVNKVTDGNKLNVRTASGLTNAIIDNILGQGEDEWIKYLNENYPIGDKERLMQNPKFAGRNHLRSQLFSFVNGKWVTDNERIKNMVQMEGGYYAEAVGLYNRTWSMPQSFQGTGMPYLSSTQKLWGGQGDIGMLSTFISEGTLGGGQISSPDVLENFDAALKGSDLGFGNSIIMMGDYMTTPLDIDAKGTTEGHPKTAKFFREVLLTNMQNPDWLKKNGIHLAYTPKSQTTYIDDITGETKAYAAYVFSNIPDDILGKKQINKLYLQII